MLKALMLRRRIDLKKKELATLREKLEGFKTREAELTQPSSSSYLSSSHSIANGNSSNKGA